MPPRRVIAAVTDIDIVPILRLAAAFERAVRRSSLFSNWPGSFSSERPRTLPTTTTP
ncbi:hypothetical protein IU450_38580 [Nocardia abscessus]|uniref:hypothetical protein n=1 Tax=Nocardia abscessus TaxID=120957 RepID=UPI0018944268|nr:hypothetical protein [Nocardia abscessus]MBF6341743.1 hypothetical protein [Nocardia abscessus]